MNVSCMRQDAFLFQHSCDFGLTHLHEVVPLNSEEKTEKMGTHTR